MSRNSHPFIADIINKKKHGNLINYKNPKKIYLPKKMTIKEIYAKLNENSYKFKNEFKLVNRFLFGKKIKFKYDKELNIKIILKVKGYVITTEAFLKYNEVVTALDLIKLINKDIPDEILVKRYNYVKQVNDTITDILI